MLSIVATIAVIMGNLLIAKNLKISIVLFIVCNICYVILMCNVKDYILMSQNIGLIGIGLYNYYKIRKLKGDELN